MNCNKNLVRKNSVDPTSMCHAINRTTQEPNKTHASPTRPYHKPGRKLIETHASEHDQTNNNSNSMRNKTQWSMHLTLPNKCSQYTSKSRRQQETDHNSQQKSTLGTQLSLMRQSECSTHNCHYTAGVRFDNVMILGEQTTVRPDNSALRLHPMQLHFNNATNCCLWTTGKPKLSLVSSNINPITNHAVGPQLAHSQRQLTTHCESLLVVQLLNLVPDCDQSGALANGLWLATHPQLVSTIHVRIH